MWGPYDRTAYDRGTANYVTYTQEIQATYKHSATVGILYEILILFDTIRRVANTLTIDFDTIRRVANTLTIDFDTIRRVAQSFTIAFDTIRPVGRTFIIDFDTVRRITGGFFELYFDTVRRIFKNYADERYPTCYPAVRGKGEYTKKCGVCARCRGLK